MNMENWPDCKHTPGNDYVKSTKIDARNSIYRKIEDDAHNAHNSGTSPEHVAADDAEVADKTADDRS